MKGNYFHSSVTLSNNLNDENQYENKTVHTLRTKELKVDIDMIDES